MILVYRVLFVQLRVEDPQWLATYIYIYFYLLYVLPSLRETPAWPGLPHCFCWRGGTNGSVFCAMLSPNSVAVRSWEASQHWLAKDRSSGAVLKRGAIYKAHKGLSCVQQPKLLWIHFTVSRLCTYGHGVKLLIEKWNKKDKGKMFCLKWQGTLKGSLLYIL